MYLADILKATPAVRQPLLEILADQDVGMNIKLVSFSASFTDQDGNKIVLEDQLHLVNTTFHLDAVYQIECYLIYKYGVQKFLTDTTLNNVSSKYFTKTPAKRRQTGGGNGVLPGT